MHHQDLTDRLVIATEEQDVLYVLHWLQEMKQQDCSVEAINNKHSWKGYSALEIITQTPPSPLCQIILELLLLHGADGQSKELLDQAMERKNMEALKIMMNWKMQGEEQATDARYLSSLSLADAANWIDSTLPSPADSEKLTGWRTPPARPTSPIHSSIAHNRSPLSRPIDHHDTSSNPIHLFIRLLASTTASDQADTQVEPTQDPRVRPVQNPTSSTSVFPIPVFLPSPISSPNRAISLANSPPPPYTLNSTSMAAHKSLELFRSPSACSTPVSYPHSSPSACSTPVSYPHSAPLQTQVESAPDLPQPNPPELVQLYIGNLPLNFPTCQVQSIFDEIGVRCLVKFCRNIDQHSYGFVLVEKNQATECIQEINKTWMQSHRLSCSFAREKEGKETFIIFDRLPLSPPPQSQLPQPQPQYIVLIFNLPLNETDSASRLTSMLPNLKLFRLFQQNQSVACTQADSPADAELLFKKLNGVQIDGRILEVIRLESEMSAEQAIRLHLQILPFQTQQNSSLPSVVHSSSYPHIPSHPGSSQPVTHKRKGSFEGGDDRTSKRIGW